MKPFILRRTKDTVLADLPPKILQDVFVDASPLQRSLYQDFAASDATQEVQGALDAGNPADADKAPHVFQVLPSLHLFAHVKCFTHIAYLTVGRIRYSPASRWYQMQAGIE